MTKHFSLVAMAVIFLVISPKLRGYVAAFLLYLGHLLQAYSPFSYVIAVLAIVSLFLFSLKRGAAPR